MPNVNVYYNGTHSIPLYSNTAAALGAGIIPDYSVRVRYNNVSWYLYFYTDSKYAQSLGGKYLRLYRNGVTCYAGPLYKVTITGIGTSNTTVGGISTSFGYPYYYYNMRGGGGGGGSGGAGGSSGTGSYGGSAYNWWVASGGGGGGGESGTGGALGTAKISSATISVGDLIKKVNPSNGGSNANGTTAYVYVNNAVAVSAAGGTKGAVGNAGRTGGSGSSASGGAGGAGGTGGGGNDGTRGTAGEIKRSTDGGLLPGALSCDGGNGGAGGATLGSTGATGGAGGKGGNAGDPSYGTSRVAGAGTAGSGGGTGTGNTCTVYLYTITTLASI